MKFLSQFSIYWRVCISLCQRAHSMEERTCYNRILWIIDSAEVTPLKAEALYPQRSCIFGGSWGGGGSSDSPETVPDPSQKCCLKGWDSVSQISICIWFCAFGDGGGRLLMHVKCVHICRLWADVVKLFSLGQWITRDVCGFTLPQLHHCLFAPQSQRRALCFCHCIPDPDPSLSKLYLQLNTFPWSFICCIAVKPAVPFREAINCSNVFVFRV